MTKLERRQSRIHQIRKQLGPAKTRTSGPLIEDDEEAATTGTPDLHHHIAKSQNNPLHIGTYVQSHDNDPATKVISHYQLI
jgi:hypothetical protein